MLNSLKNLYKNEYNKQHVFFALRRLLYWKIIRLLGLRDVKYQIWSNKKILLDGNSFHSMWLMYNYIVDWEEFNMIQDYLQEKDVVFDIGTNIGYYTIWISKFITEGGKIHCFEPDANNFKKLKQNIDLNKIENIVMLNNIALSDRDGLAAFTIGLDGRNHISLNHSTQTTYVETVMLDDYVNDQNIQHIDYAKIDVEGFECNVLKGAEYLLNQKRIDVIQLEINQTLENSNRSIDDVLMLLQKHHYTLCGYDVDQKTLHPISYSKDRENYFAVHNLDRVNHRLSLNSWKQQRSF